MGRNFERRTRATLPREPSLSSGCRLFLSAASSWEIAVKYALGTLPLPEPPERFVLAQASMLELTLLTADPAVAQYPVQTLLV